MRKKLIIILFVCLLCWIASVLISFKLFIALTIVGILGVLLIVLFVIANKLIKKTNWWRNQYLSTEQFVSNSGYRDNIIRNYDIVNLGSNPARFAFFYESVKGQSWATGSQGQDMDFEILKYYHSYIKEGGIVVIPIMPFTALSPYLKQRQEYWGVEYYSKFAKILDNAQVQALPNSRKVQRYLAYPLLYNRRAFRYVIKDVVIDTKYEIADQKLMLMDLEQESSFWIEHWIKEFRLGSLSDVFNDKWSQYYNEAITLNKKIVDFCLERGLKPVFVCIPMTSHLSSRFPSTFYKYMVTDFVKKCNFHNVPFYDYTYDERFKDDGLYLNSFFLNLRGRKFFTEQFLKDLKLI